jgi:hypothetical protein
MRVCHLGDMMPRVRQVRHTRRGHAEYCGSFDCGGDQYRTRTGRLRADLDNHQLHDDLQCAGGELSNELRGAPGAGRSSEPQQQSGLQSQRGGGWHLPVGLQFEPAHVPVGLRATIAVTIGFSRLEHVPEKHALGFDPMGENRFSEKDMQQP